ncbi:MAG: pyridoxal phosphate-dependent aminotransferase [Planctomycetota bacterium]
MTLTRSTPLSSRVRSLPASATLAVTAKVKALKAEGRDIIGFGVGEPDFDTPLPIRQSAIRALEAGKTHYMPVPGDPVAREAIAAKLRDENGIDCAAEHIVISTGAKQSLYLLFQCLLDPPAAAAPPQEVLVPTPGWVSYRPIIELAGGRVVELPTTVEGDFRISPAQLRDAITPNTVAIILNSPSNPCGTMYGPDELEALAAVLAEHEDIVIVADDIYERLVYGTMPFKAIGSIPSVADRVVTINGMSKSYAMTGWRIGYTCAPGWDGAIARAMARLQSQMTSCITSFCYDAIVEALEHGADDVERMRRTFAERAEVMVEEIARWPSVRCPRPTGAFYMFPDIGDHFGKSTPAGRTVDSAVPFAEALLEEAGVGVVPGDDFGECARRHVRLSFAADEPTIREGCRRIRTWLESLS